MRGVFQEVILDAGGQNERLSRLYTQLCFCFPLPDTSPTAQDAIAASLEIGLQRLSNAFPWIAGQVVRDDTGIFQITSWKATPELSVRDLKGQLPSMQEYRIAGFPFSLLDEDLIAPRKTLPERLNEPAEVFLLQANFIQDGLLLVMMGQHNCMDMAGLGQVIYLFSKACLGEEFSESDLRSGHLARKDITPSNENQSKPDISKTDPASSSNENKVMNEAEQETTWVNIIFSASSIASLKKEANATKSGVSFVSTDDIVSAVLWQAWTRARRSRLRDPDESSSFQRQVDVRRHLDLPTEYIGMAVHTVSTTLTVSELCKLPLGAIASELRKTLETTDLGACARAAAAKSLKSTASGTSNARPKVPPFDIKMSSWAKEKCYELDFGPGIGKPEAVRRPAFEAWDGLAYLLPKKLDGDIVACICIRVDDLRSMGQDGYLDQFARLVG